MNKKEVIYVKQKTSGCAWTFLIIFGLLFVIGLATICSRPDNRPAKPHKPIFVMQNMEEIPEGFFLGGGMRNYSNKGMPVNITYKIFEDNVVIKEGKIENVLYKYVDAGKGTTFGEVVEYKRKTGCVYTYELKIN